MRVIALHRDLIVFVSRVWQTTATAIRAGDEGFLIDSPVFPDELEALPSVLEQSRFPVSGLLATHGDWDHLLGRLAFPSTSLGCGESTAGRIAAEAGGAQRELRAFDEQYYLAGQRALRLGDLQPLPVPGRLALGDAEDEIELHLADGHTADGTAYWIPSLKILVCGDYLSPVEIPVLATDGHPDVYLATLKRLGELVDQAETVVPGHGHPQARARARELLDEDVAYVQALVGGRTDAQLPAGRRSSAQRRLHAENLKHLRLS